MISLRLFVLSMTLLPSLWAEQDPGSSITLDKRFSINMMDPLTRRSALDKNFVRFGRSGGGVERVNRDGRPRSDSFVRFGRSFDDDDEEDDLGESVSRDTRGRTDFIRFGRGGTTGTSSGFIRFGRGKNDNFVRFGKARPDSFIRFGKNSGNPMLYGDEFRRLSRSGNGPNGHNTNFVRFGKRDPENNEEIVNAYKNGLNLNFDEFRKENLARIARLSNRNKGDSFIRFGRIPATVDDTSDNILMLPDLKAFGNQQHIKDEQILNENTQNNDRDLETPTSNHFTPYEQTEGDVSRKKRSILNENAYSPTDSPNESPLYSYPSALAAGLPNFIIGPELSMLPPQTKSRDSGKKIDDKNFIRLG